MRPNGLQLVIDMAVTALGEPRVSRFRDALVLGTLRENVRWLPGIGVLYEHLSLSHFYKPGLPGGFIPFLTTGARRRGNQLFAAALREGRAGREAAAFVQLGRFSHLVADMACPVHVHRVAHWTDPFEWYVDAHCDELAGLSVPEVPAQPRPSDLIDFLARKTVRLRPDRTNNLPGRALRLLGAIKPPTRDELAEQARKIVPLAAGTLAAALRKYLAEVA